MPAAPAPPPLILASTSPYRRSLLGRLNLPFICLDPGVEEHAPSGAVPAELAARLAAAKAQAIAAHHPAAVVIGGDQVAECDGAILGKPGTAERARAQLAAASGRVVRFHTAVHLTRGELALAHVDLTSVHFRRLEAAEISRYVELDEPFDCAGSFRSEGLGSALLERIESADPSALLGLPLIWLCAALRRAGLDALRPAAH